MNITLLNYDTVDSTNTEALNQAQLGGEEGLCIVARQQTAGRGRHGRAWVSEKDAGLYFSILLRPKLDTQYLPLVTLMAGVAVHDTLAEFGITADIKWVNDLLVDEKKICGILAETTETPGGLAVIVGIGINLKSSNFPPEIAETAISLEEIGPGIRSLTETEGPPCDESTPSTSEPSVRTQLIEALTRNIAHVYETLSTPDGPALILEEWRLRSSYFAGKRVRISLPNETVTGTTEGLEPNGALRLRKDDSSLLIVQAGDVERLRSEKLAGWD